MVVSSFLDPVQRRYGYISTSDFLAEHLRSKAREWSAAAQAELKHCDVFASMRGFGNTADFWIRTGYHVHLTSSEQEVCEQELQNRVSELLSDYSERCTFFIIAAGDYDYTSLVRRFEDAGCKCHIWLVAETQIPSEHSLHVTSMPQLLQLPFSDNADSNPIETQSLDYIFKAVIEGKTTSPPTSQLQEGVVKLIESEIIRRTKSQLEMQARKYSTNATVNIVFDALITQIKESGFVPDAIISWIDQARHWSGSQTVARELSKALKCPIEVVEVREEGEQREVIYIPNLRNYHHALVVDDATMTGNTLNILTTRLKERYPVIEFRKAVLLSKASLTSSIDFYGDTHNGDDVLFPWGWARTINMFYGLLGQLGTQDKRWMPREVIDGISITKVVQDQVCTVQLLSVRASQLINETMSQDYSMHKTDDLLYFVSGETEVYIDSSQGVFRSEEFLFVPRVVPFRLVLGSDSVVLQFSLGGSHVKK